MSLSAYNETEAIYVNASLGITISKAVHIPSSTAVVLKRKVCSQLKEANRVIAEAMNQSKLAHPAIVKVYECLLVQKEERFEAVIVLESLERDLMHEIQSRKSAIQHWSEFELLTHLRDLSSACAYAQSLSIAHRDIKPQNVLMIESRVKIGDFGTSVAKFGEMMDREITGTPYYLSPELKAAYRKGLQGEAVAVDYDPYTSDVYSLGVTLLYMNQLEAPVWLTDLSALAENTQGALRYLDSMPCLQYALSYMLAVDPSQRASFQQVYEFCEPRIQPAAPQPAPEPVSEPVAEPVGVPSSSQGLNYPSLIESSGLYPSLPEIAQSKASDKKASSAGQKCCSVCHNEVQDILWQENVPANLQMYSVMFSEVCSQTCLLILCKRDYSPTTCLFDSRPLQGQQVLALLQCSHGFCNVGCLSRFLRQLFTFEPAVLQFECRVCSHMVTEKELVQFYASRAKMMRQLFQVEEMGISKKCENCLSRPVEKKMKCEHKVCFACLKRGKPHVVICPLCGKSDSI